MWPTKHLTPATLSLLVGAGAVKWEALDDDPPSIIAYLGKSNAAKLFTSMNHTLLVCTHRSHISTAVTECAQTNTGHRMCSNEHELAYVAHAALQSQNVLKLTQIGVRCPCRFCLGADECCGCHEEY